MDVVDRFWSKVQIGGPDDCWPWLAGCFDKSYGAFSVTSDILVQAHRFACEITDGALPDDVVVRHSCDNPPCCNPSHLLRGTELDNINDRQQRGRQARGETSGNSKLTAEQVLLIRADTRDQRAIAADYGVSKSLVGAIKRGEVWAELNEAREEAKRAVGGE